MANIVIVEDTPSEAQQLIAHLRRYESENPVDFTITHFDNAQDFVRTKIDADLIFMDIDLPGLGGMQAARILRTYHRQTPLIFITNLAQFAVHGYEVDAIDFMVKPVNYGSFAVRMDRAMRVLYTMPTDSFMLTADDGMHVIAVKDLAYVDIKKHDLYYHCVNGIVYKRRGTISAVFSGLENKGFIKIAASCIINMAQVQTIQIDHVVMNTQETLWFSRKYKNQALFAITNYLGRS